MVLAEFVAVDHVLPAAGRVQQACRDAAAGALAVPQDGPQRNDTRPAGQQHQRAAFSGLPHEVPAEARPLAYICGPTSFVETAAAALVGLGYPPERVKTERFGGTGGH